jgi:hypothetical protein
MTLFEISFYKLSIFRDALLMSLFTTVAIVEEFTNIVDAPSPTLSIRLRTNIYKSL